MQERTYGLLVGIIILALVAIWVDLPDNPGLYLSLGPVQIDREIKVHEGLDLQGGLQVLLEADLPADQSVSREAMLAAKGIVENRVNGLGVTEPLIQMQGERRIIVELPGLSDPDQAIKTFGQTGLLEFVDAGYTPLQVGMRVKTDFGGAEEPTGAITPTVPLTATPAVVASPTAELGPTAPVTATPGLVVTPTGEITPTTPLTPTAPVTPTQQERIFETVMTGQHLKSANVGFDNLGRPRIEFSLTSEGAKIFADYTASHVGQYLAIAMDKIIISSPVIKSPIPDGSGVIEGGDQGFPLAEAQGIVIQLKYGALPVPLRVAENRTVGPTLGQDSVRKSVLAGQIGLLIVVAFMLLYYRLPGFLADVALGIYAALVFALFKLIPVTLTLPGIAGFILSVGMAVDANILIFERLKEELRAGKVLGAAIEAGFSRAWPSIRDSNFSTLITCGILFWFGSYFGASIVKGFALTLAIGVLISMFTAILVTRTFLRLIMGMDVTRNHWWFGV